MSKAPSFDVLSINKITMLQASLSARQVFDHQDMESMTKQQRRFAQQQLRHIFSHEMSKVSVALDRKHQINSKLVQLQQSQKEQLEKAFERLNQRMSHVDSKRKQQITKRIESCRTYDNQWRTKMTEVEKRMRKENKAAEARIRKFKEERDEYMKKKEEIAHKINEKRISMSNNPRISVDERNYRTQFARPTITHSEHRTSRRTPHPRTKLDASIQDHKLKSHRLQHDRQQETLQKALSKLQTINQRRKKMISMYEGSHPDKRVPIKSTNRVNPRRSLSPKQRAQSNSVLSSPKASKKSNRLLPMIDHTETKKYQQKKEFKERGDIFQKNLERTKKQQILRQIKQKVNEYKVLAQRD